MGSDYFQGPLELPSLVTNVWQLLTGSSFRALLLRLDGMMLGIALGTAAGSGLIAGASGRFATVAVGLTLLVYALAGLARWRLQVPIANEPWAGPLVGLVTGVVTGATGV